MTQPHRDRRWPDGLVDAVQHRLARERRPVTAHHLADAVRAETNGTVLVDDAAMLDLLRTLEHELVGCGPLTDLLADPLTTDVVVNSAHDVRVDRGDGWETAAVRFADDAAVQRLARRLAGLCGARLDDAHPYVDGRLPGGVRLHAVLPALSPTGTCLSLRVLRPRQFSLVELAARSAFPGITQQVLRAIIKAQCTFIVCGGTGTGKTTMLAALLAEVAASERIVLVEDAEELQLTHPHVVHLVARPANVEGAGAIGLPDLVRQSLRMRPDRIVVGEVRGPEVVDLLTALNTGHAGSAGTIHANSAADVPARMCSLALAGGLPLRAAHAHIVGAIQIIVELRRRHGQRLVTTIAVVQQDGEGLARALPAIVEGQPTLDGGVALADLLRRRGVDPPWQ